MNRRHGLLALGLAALSARAAPADGRLLVAYPPGGLSDDVARHLARALAVAGGGWPVDHRPGAGGRIALDLLARAPADGRTLAYCAATPLTLRPHVVPGRPPPPVTPVLAVLQVPALLVATAASPARHLADVLATARAEPGRLRWATSGIATTGHEVLAQLRAATGVAITHIPYTGGGHPITDALAGHVELLLTNAAPQQLDLIRQQRLWPLAVGAASRLSALPDVPTFAELGLPGANLASLFGVFAPPGTPAATVQRLNGTMAAALADTAWRRRLEAAGCEVLGGPADGFAARLRAEADAVQRLVRAGGAVFF